MTPESLEDARKRARILMHPMREELTKLGAEIDAGKNRREALEAEPADWQQYRGLAAYLFIRLQRRSVLQPKYENLERLTRAVQGIRTDYLSAIPGCGLLGAWFCARSFKIEDGKPAAYDPFWIDDLALDGQGRLPEFKARHAAWASGDQLELPSGKGHIAAPHLWLAKPFGQAGELAHGTCGGCQADAPVVGFLEFGHWTEDDDWPYKQGLYALCLSCLRLTTLAEREDQNPVRLYPKFIPVPH